MPIEKVNVIWFTDYLGVAYAGDPNGWLVFPIFSSPAKAEALWNEKIEPMNEQSLRMRFIEYGDKYRFIMYSEPLRADKINFAFYRSMGSSETYKIFKANFSGKVYLDRKSVV